MIVLHAVSVHAQEDSLLSIDQAGRGEMVSRDPIGCYIVLMVCVGVLVVVIGALIQRWSSVT